VFPILSPKETLLLVEVKELQIFNRVAQKWRFVESILNQYCIVCYILISEGGVIHEKALSCL
jgi:hypothetical protein